MAVLLDGASRLQAKLVPRESIGGEALYVQDPLDAENKCGQRALVLAICFEDVEIVEMLPEIRGTVSAPAGLASLGLRCGGDDW